VKAGVLEDKIHIAPDGVDMARFNGVPEREAARDELSLPKDLHLAVYTGQLFEWKGVDTLVRAAAYMDGWKIILVGGRKDDCIRLRTTVADLGVEDKVTFIDHVPPDRIPIYLSAADVVVLPNSARFTISSRYTSPMKLFEYMAARRPIIASDLPSLTEVLSNEENALLFQPDDPKGLADCASRLLTDVELKDRIVSKASVDVTGYTWRERALKIIDFLKLNIQRGSHD